MILVDIFKFTNIGEIILLIFAFLVLQSTVFVILLKLFKISDKYKKTTGYVSYIMSFAAIMIFAVLNEQNRSVVLNSMNLAGVSWKQVIFIAVSAVCMYFISILNNRLWDKGTKTSSFYTNTSFSAFQALFVIVIAPICEELLFRGLLLPSLKPQYGVVWSVLYSSLLFGLFHIRPKIIIPSFLAGIILGCLTINSGSIIPAAITHCLYNLLSMNSYFKISGKIKEYLRRDKAEVKRTGYSE